MGLLDSLFGSKVNIPSAVTVDPTKAAQGAASFNQSQAGQFQQYAPQLTDFIHNLFSQQYPQVGQALQTNSNLGQQLATTGTTKAMTDAMAYYRQLGLQTAASTGAPISSAFAQNLGGSLGAQQILQNQLQGSNILNGVTSQGGQLGMQQLQPAFGVLNSSLTTPGQFMQTESANAQAQNQQGILASEYNAQANPAATYLMQILSSVGGQAAGLGLSSAFGNPMPALKALPI